MEQDMTALMGGLGVIGLVLVLAAVLVLPFIAVKRNRDKEGMARLAFLGRFCALLVAVIVLSIITAAMPILAIGMLIVQLIVSYVFYGFMVRRLTHAGWSPWLVYVSIIPGIGFLFLLALFIVPGKDSELGNQAA